MPPRVRRKAMSRVVRIGCGAWCVCVWCECVCLCVCVWCEWVCLCVCVVGVGGWVGGGVNRDMDPCQRVVAKHRNDVDALASPLAIPDCIIGPLTDSTTYI